MADVLFIKTSSLGDVIHHMPALTEARARRPADRFAWVVEEAFAPLVRLHPAAGDVIPVAGRRWRGLRLAAPSTWSQIAAFLRRLRAHEYAEVIDVQGLFFKSALIAKCARGRTHGYDAASIKEPLAARLYDVRHHVEWKQHAIARNRELTGLALGYAPQGAPDYGLDAFRAAAKPATPYGVLLHATAEAGKQWPVDNWRSLAAALASDFEPVLPWGTNAERDRARGIASGVPRARVLDEKKPLDEVARLIAAASFVVGVDTGLTHLAAALGVPLVAIFTDSEPGLTGPIGRGRIEVLGGKGSPPPVAEVAAAVRRVVS